MYKCKAITLAIYIFTLIGCDIYYKNTLIEHKAASLIGEAVPHYIIDRLNKIYRDKDAHLKGFRLSEWASNRDCSEKGMRKLQKNGYIMITNESGWSGVGCLEFKLKEKGYKYIYDYPNNSRGHTELDMRLGEYNKTKIIDIEKTSEYRRIANFKAFYKLNDYGKSHFNWATDDKAYRGKAKFIMLEGGKWKIDSIIIDELKYEQK